MNIKRLTATAALIIGLSPFEVAAQLEIADDATGRSEAAQWSDSRTLRVLPDGTVVHAGAADERPVRAATSASAQAVEVTVRQDGQGDATTIQGGIDLAQPGDKVVVFPGVYHENVLISKELVVRSQAGPGRTVIDGMGSDAAVKLSGGVSAATVFEGFAVRNGAPVGVDAGGIVVEFSSPTVRDNQVYANTGPGMSARGAGTPAFVHNLVVGNSGPGFLNWSSTSSILQNRFIANGTHGLELYNGPPALIAGNLVARNAGLAISATIPSGAGPVQIENSTFVGNGRGIELTYFADQVTLFRNIVVHNAGYGLVCGSPYSLCPVLDQNDLWSNQLGEYSGPVSAPTDLNVDPEFCGPRNYGLHDTSPCVLDGDGFIGALGPRC